MIITHLGVFGWLLQYRYWPAPPDLRPVVEIDIIEPQTAITAAEEALLPMASELVDTRQTAQPEASPAPRAVGGAVQAMPRDSLEVLADDTGQQPDLPDIAVTPRSDRTAPAEMPNSDRLTTFAALLNCQNFARRQDAACRDSPAAFDPSRRMPDESAITPPQLELRFAGQNRVEYLLSQNKRTPYLMPGMDGDLFTEGLPPGAYNAQRIRNGESPIWSRELERKLKGEE